MVTADPPSEALGRHPDLLEHVAEAWHLVLEIADPAERAAVIADLESAWSWRDADASAVLREAWRG